MKVTKHVHQHLFLRIDEKKVKLARVDKGWTITKLSEASGVSRKTIGEIEKGYKNKIRYSTILQIAISLEKKLDDLCSQTIKKEEGEAE
ncbi:helix-turn-helix transcriptional regulator [Thalassorhabdus alkalitolerans]|uniref:Helix-turn-helix transcriptional regulator n=1 Tax=Thalassorhabdus alkalitolerans TaxID=2282697 RepID=A0ABW0YMX7_9BACI